MLGKNPLTTNLQLRQFKKKIPNLILPKNLTINIISQRPDIAAAKLRVQTAMHKINVAKARFFPDINLSALIGYQSSIGLNNLFNAESRNNAITAALDLPIFDAGARRANLRALLHKS